MLLPLCVCVCMRSRNFRKTTHLRHATAVHSSVMHLLLHMLSKTLSQMSPRRGTPTKIKPITQTQTQTHGSPPQHTKHTPTHTHRQTHTRGCFEPNEPQKSLNGRSHSRSHHRAKQHSVPVIKGSKGPVCHLLKTSPTHSHRTTHRSNYKPNSPSICLLCVCVPHTHTHIDLQLLLT